MKPLLVTSGEPAGIGPDLCLALAALDKPLVVLGDKNLLAARAKQLQLSIDFDEYQPGKPWVRKKNHLTVLSVSCNYPVTAGVLNPDNAPYVIDLLTIAAESCLRGEFSALVTAPIHKGVINQAGFTFTGHTEFLSQHCHAKEVVMMLACDEMRVALVTTHLPLGEVAKAITPQKLIDVISCVHRALQVDFGLRQPKILVAGLNPHAGESGYLGREEIDIITPTLKKLQQKGLDVQGPLPADTMFTPQYIKNADAFVVMYHDQGLPVLKYASFGHAVNISLGLPIIRTSVDHGTALELAATGKADPGSLLAAVEMATQIVMEREKK